MINTLEMVMSRKNFFRDHFRRMATTLFFCMLIILSLIGAILYVYFNRGEHAYYATSGDGNLTRLMPVPRGTGLEKISKQQKIFY